MNKRKKQSEIVGFSCIQCLTNVKSVTFFFSLLLLCQSFTGRANNIVNALHLDNNRMRKENKIKVKKKPFMIIGLKTKSSECKLLSDFILFFFCFVCKAFAIAERNEFE